jgi:hemolysin activation/secretion protein
MPVQIRSGDKNGARCTRLIAGAAATVVNLIAAAVPACAEQATASPPAQADAAPKTAASTQKPAATQHFNIDDFAVQGGETLPQIEIEKAIYPFLGPNKTADDIEKARAALEKAYHDKGYQTVSVAVPQQNVSAGVVALKVTELKVGRLRVKNSRFFDIDKIKDGAPSLKEGTVPNFGDVTKDIVSLNQWPDRRVTPALRAGVTPGTVDVDLNVEDTAPLHGSLEVNNRQSPSTTPDRIIGTVHYDNLWQLGHSFSFTYQVAPERPDDAQVFSASYLAHVPGVDWLSFLTYGVKSDSNVATVGGTNIVGPGQIIGERAVFTLPSLEGLFHTISVGMDYKSFGQIVSLGGSAGAACASGTGTASCFSSPITYYPLVASYSATFKNDKFATQLNASLTYNVRPMGSNPGEFDNKRFDASANFTHFNLDVSHTQELPEGFQAYARVQGQLADGPLVSSEQFSLGGLDTVRGYLESEVLGDNGVVGTVEMRSPDLGGFLQKNIKNETGEGPPRFNTFNEWRFFAFLDSGEAVVMNPLSEQQSRFSEWSYGIGTRFKFFDHINGMVVGSMPMVTQTSTHAGDPRVNFRIWGEF